MENLSFIDNKVFDKSVTIVVDIFQEIYRKNGLAYVDITHEYEDPVYCYRNLGIEILQNGYLPDISAVMLELAMVKIENSYNLSIEQKNILLLLKHLFPKIQTMNIEYILDFQSMFCSGEVALNNYMKISKYLNP